MRSHLRLEFLVDLDGDPRARLSEADVAPVAAIAVLPQDEDLRRHLEQLGLPRHPVRPGPALLVINGRDRSVLPLDEIHLGDQAEAGSVQGHGAGLARPAVLDFLGVGNPASAPVAAPVGELPFGRIGVVSPEALHPLEVEEARAVDELVQHAGRDKRWDRG